MLNHGLNYRKKIFFLLFSLFVYSCDTNYLKIESRNPSLSPNGQLIAFELGHPNIGYQIYIVDINGSQAVPLIPQANQKNGESHSEPSWSPDGQHIAFVAKKLNTDTSTSPIQANSGLVVTTMNGAQRVQLTSSPGDQAPTWSADGKRLTFASLQEGSTDVFSIFTINSDGSFRKQINNVTGFDPVFTPNGQRIIYSTGPNIFLVNQDGTNQIRFTHFPSAKVKQPTISPNGQLIAFSADVNAVEGTPPHYQIFIVNSKGLNLQQLTQLGNNTDPAWAFDNSKIAFTSDRTGRREVFTMTANGQFQTRVTDSAFFDLLAPQIPQAPVGAPIPQDPLGSQAPSSPLPSPSAS